MRFLRDQKDSNFRWDRILVLAPQVYSILNAMLKLFLVSSMLKAMLRICGNLQGRGGAKDWFTGLFELVCTKVWAKKKLPVGAL